MNFLNFLLLSSRNNENNTENNNNQKSGNSLIQKFDSNTDLKSTSISDQNRPDIDIRKEENDENKPKSRKYFIYVDPLDDFGSASVAREKCEELGTALIQLYTI